MSVNGRLEESDLAPIPGGRLSKDAAEAWLAMRKRIGDEKGVWICPTSQRTAYRTFDEQQYFWKLFQAGTGARAAQPGTSNHGWGRAVDIPKPEMQAAVRACGHEYGWGIAGGQLPSDAPGEAWHATFHPGHFEAKEPPKPQHPYLFMNVREREARDILIKERRTARRHGGWDQVDGSHLKRAVAAKKTLRRCAVDISAAAKKTGWETLNRQVRYDYIKKLIGGRA